MTNNLRELTKEIHKKVESAPFVQRMIAGKLSNEEYHAYLIGQFHMYIALERADLKLHQDFYDILRYDNIIEDIEFFENELKLNKKIVSENLTTVVALKSVQAYLNHIQNIKHDQAKLLAHFYVRHMGDLSGGQILKKRVPGIGRMYEFNRNVQELKEELRSKLSDDMLDEALLCFAMMYHYLIELGEFLDAR